MNNSGSGFTSNSFFDDSFFDDERRREARRKRLQGLPPAPDKVPRALFASTEDRIALGRREVIRWREDIEAALLDIEDGTTRGVNDAVRDLETLRDRIEDVVRSANGASHPDRTAG